MTANKIKKISFSVFTFENSPFFGFFLKSQNGPKNKNHAKNGNNHLSAPHSFIFLHRNVIFDVQLFSPSFEMES